MPSFAEASGSNPSASECTAANAQFRRERRNVQGKEARARKRRDGAVPSLSCECQDFFGLIALASPTFPQHACFRSNRWCYCCSPADIGLSLLASFVHCPRHDGHVSEMPLPLPEDIIEPLQT